MKKHSFLLCATLLAATSSFAQTLNIHFNNGTSVEFNKELINYVDFSEKASEPTLTAGEAVDLGLSVKWASCNLGAETPDAYGNYYAWGETTTKSSYSQNAYAYYNKSTTEYTDIGSNIAGTQYDAASVNLGKGWRMPTKTEMQELLNKCKWEWVQVNGKNGYKITATNGNSIFMPAAGCFTNASTYEANEYVYCWTATKYDSEFACSLNANSSIKGFDYLENYKSKFRGLTIRPVISYDDADGTDYDDSAVTSKVYAYYAGGSIMSNSGTILSGSKLNFYFKNGSAESVTLTDIRLINGSTKTESSNLLSADTTVAAGESSGYTITVGAAGTVNPTCRFTYRYNNHTYTTSAAYQEFNFAKGKTMQLMAE